MFEQKDSGESSTTCIDVPVTGSTSMDTSGTLPASISLSRKSRKNLVQDLQCPMCQYKSVTASALKIHIRKHTGEKPFKCDLCDYSAAILSNLKRHKMCHDAVPGEHPYKCHLCDFSSTQAAHLKAHFRIHTGEKPFKCEFCDFKASQASHLKIHRIKHTGEKPFICQMCDYRSAHASNLKRHILKHTEKSKTYKCDFCDYSSEKAGNVKQHLLTHTEKQQIEVKSSQANVKQHQETHIEEQSDCNYDSKSARSIRKHKQFKEKFCSVLSDTGEKLYACPYYKCEYKSVSPDDLKLHVKTHLREKTYTCDICDFKTARIGYLKRHRRTHNRQTLECDVCGYKTTKMSNLRQHMVSHSGQKPYKCELCNFESGRSNNLKRHIRKHFDPNSGSRIKRRKPKFASDFVKVEIHLDEESYKCDMCDFQCVYRNDLKQHILTHTEQLYIKQETYIEVEIGTQNKPIENNFSELDHQINLCTQNDTSKDPNADETLYKCDMCKFETSFRNSFKEHILTHTAEKPIIPDTEYENDSNNHTSPQTSDEVIKCNMCDFKSIHTNDFKQHILTQHSNKNEYVNIKLENILNNCIQNML